jgi:glutamate dehydrogenase
MSHTQEASRLDEAARLAAAAAPGIGRFVHEFYRNVPQAETRDRSPADLAEAALSMWRFAADRVPGRPKIRPLQTGPGRGVVQVVNDDMPYLVDSVGASLTRLGFEIDLVIHPVLAVRRDETGRLIEAVSGSPGPDKAGAAPESMMHLELIGDLGEERRASVIERLDAVLADVRAVAQDGPAMRALVGRIADEIASGSDEDAAFLRWLDGNFLILGTRHYALDGNDLEVVHGVGRGLLRSDAFAVFDGLRAITRASPDVQAFLRDPQLTMISKSNRRATVHRPIPMDTVIVKAVSAAGAVVGLRLILGLFTTDSYSRLPHEIPVLRQKVRRCHERSGFAPDGRDGMALQQILDSFPRDELFQIDETQLYDTAIGILHLQQRPRLALFTLRDPFERFVTCLVYLPRDRFNAEIGRRIAAILESAFGGSISYESMHLDGRMLTRLRYVIATVPGQTGDLAVPEIERRLTEALRTWADRLTETLLRQHGTTAGTDLLRRYATAFPPAYCDRFGVETAAHDILFAESLAAGEALCVCLSREGEDIRLKLFHPGSPVALSDVLPMLENLGMRVLNEIPFEIAPRGAAAPVWIQDFELHAREPAVTGADTLATRFEDAFRQVWSGALENDGFNRLVLTAGLDAREIVVLRTYCKLLRQAGIPFSQAYMEDTASAHPAIAANLVRLFVTRADPVLPEADRSARAAAIVAEIRDHLEEVQNLDEDRILRGFLLLIEKTLRTNFYQRDAAGRPKLYLSIKLASREIDLLPLPRPLVEIFVYSPRMEGCHLRGGKVARGGIRWSDRKEDFRTEILGLMKAQMVKNAVIVPIGSKGGFVVKRPPAEGGREALMAEVIACYRTLMNGLLDLTDDIAGDAIIPPKDVVRHDPDDTYLVVAADKGTATFSDIANGVAVERGFWLGDAFASGGSVGYDHKVMGITAKGAWEAVKRHFREIGTDIQTSNFTCVGVGDMAGDVFGNGMLLSRHTKLVAAFNHMHVFLDPDPDPERSFVERKRLFDLPRSTWADYDRALISQGGGIFERRAKAIPLSPQIRALLGIEAEQLPPAHLIQALLRADVDLLWFGGIGTYVKASTETDAQAGDRANDSLRIDATAIRAKVVGEGANLAVTHRARIEYALHGGRINTDAIDNSAGVDTSDHEVNIKIAVGDAIAAGLIPPAERNGFLASMTDEVEHLVLRDNILQTLALSLTEARAPALLDTHAGLMRAMERRGRLDRAVEFLPDDEALAQRAAAGRGLTRPEIAVLLAYVKNGLYEDLLRSSLPDLPELRDELFAYFPTRLREVAATTLGAHRLKREIIATIAANALVNRMGPSFIETTQSRTGRDPAAIVAAFFIARDIFGLSTIWAEIEALDNIVPAAAQTWLFHAVSHVVDQAVRWFLLCGLTLEPAARIAEFKPGVDTLLETISSLLPQREREVNEAKIRAYVEAGVPEGLAGRVVLVNTASTAMDIVRIAGECGGDVRDVARVYLAAGVDFGLLELRRKARIMPAGTQWQRLAADALTEDSYAQQREIVRRIVAGSLSATEVTRRAGPGTELHDVLTEIGRTTPPDLAMLTVASRRIRAAAA